MGFSLGSRRPQEKEISGCGVVGLLNKKGKRVSGEIAKKAICLMNDRGNGLGSGFAAYGIYPDYKELYAFHIMYDDFAAQLETEEFLENNFKLEKKEEIPHRDIPAIHSQPLLWRYFVEPKRSGVSKEMSGLQDDDYVVRAVLTINARVSGGYVFSSGKNMGVFKGVGFPEDISEFYQIEMYEGYLWTAHNRFPTNTPGWWGGAHPFTLLDWSIVHNGEISSYGINKRYLEMFGYQLTLLTDTEVVAYLLDLLIRKHGLPIPLACKVLAAPFWKDIEAMPEEEKQVFSALRMAYGSALLNGPFAIIFGHSRGMVGLNDRIKLRPLVAALEGDFAYLASEESAIIEICSYPDKVWAPTAGEPMVAELDEGVA